MTQSHSSVKDKLVLDYDASAIGDSLPDVLSVLVVDGSQNIGMDTAWLKAELSKPGRSQSALARFMNVAPEIVNRIVNKKREIKAREADQIRSYLTATANGDYATMPHITPKPAPASLLPVRGTVEAGSWREVAFTDLEHEPETLPAPRSVVDSGAFALRVSGPSMDRMYPDGSFVVVQPWHGGPMPVGRRVVVERSRPDGLVETTVKELVRRPDGEFELWPRSTHPAHQTPVPFKDDDTVTVRIIGTVVWRMAPE